jgi:hypothetical protein
MCTRTKFEEKMVEQNGVSNYLMVNTASENQRMNCLANTGLYTQSVFDLFSICPDQHTFSRYLFSTSFNNRGNCIGIDPLYVGEISDDENGK